MKCLLRHSWVPQKTLGSGVHRFSKFGMTNYATKQKKSNIQTYPRVDLTNLEE